MGAVNMGEYPFKMTNDDVEGDGGGRGKERGGRGSGKGFALVSFPPKKTEK